MIKRIIYGIGCFLVILFLGAGMLFSYQISVLKDRLSMLEETAAETKTEASAFIGGQTQELIFEKYEEGKLVRDSYQMTAFGSERVVLRQASDQEEDSGFVIRVKDGMLVVYENGGNQIFEYTDILLETLPSSLQEEVLLGKKLQSLDELYGFLENYSS